MSYYYIILPAIYGYVMKGMCPFVSKEEAQNRHKELSDQGIAVIYDAVWPLLFLMVGFSWFFSREKAAAIQRITNETGKVLTKGSREAALNFGKLFGKVSHATALDTAYTIFVLLLGWWLVVNTCTTNRRNDMLVLFLTSMSGGLLLYLITSYGKRGLFALLPVVMWLFFANQYNVTQFTKESKKE